MGAHAFLSPPQHCDAYAALAGSPLPEIFGVDAGWNMPVVRHEGVLGAHSDFPGVDHFVITCHLGGARVRRTDNPRFSTAAERGAISMQSPGNGCSVRSEDGRPVKYAHFYCRQELFDEVLGALGAAPRTPLKDFFGCRNLGCDQEMSHYLARAGAHADPPTALEMDSRPNLIALAIARFSLGAPSGSPLPSIRPMDRRRVAAAVALIEERLPVAPTLSQLATHVGLSAFHFSRSFKAATGETPMAYAARRQAERARDMITLSRLPLAEVALRAGYSSQSHMTRRLRALLGATPAQLRGRGPNAVAGSAIKSPE